MVLGVAIIVQAFVAKDIFLGIMGLIFSSLAIFNTGCCGPAGCNIPAKKTAEPAKEITYEDLSLSNMWQLEALTRLLVKKGLFTIEEFREELLELKKEHEKENKS